MGSDVSGAKVEEIARAEFDARTFPPVDQIELLPRRRVLIDRENRRGPARFELERVEALVAPDIENRGPRQVRGEVHHGELVGLRTSRFAFRRHPIRERDALIPFLSLNLFEEFVTLDHSEGPSKVTLPALSPSRGALDPTRPQPRSATPVPHWQTQRGGQRWKFQLLGPRPEGNTYSEIGQKLHRRGTERGRGCPRTEASSPTQAHCAMGTARAQHQETEDRDRIGDVDRSVAIASRGTLTDKRLSEMAGGPSEFPGSILAFR